MAKRSSSSVTIHDVARRAGVAPITVSRVINDSGYVSPQTRDRVEAAVEALGYVPNMLARSLRSNRTNTLALVVTDISNPFWTTVARGAEDAANARGFNVILCNTDESQAKQDEYLAMLLRKRVDGFLLVPAGSRGDSVRAIQKQDVPVVVLDRAVSAVDVDVVRCDSEDGAYRLTRYLISLGHRRIAILSGPRAVTSASERVRGYRRALEEADIAFEPTLVQHGHYSVESGRSMAARAIGIPDRPTALFAGNNLIAIGVMKLLQEETVRVPEDLSVVSFDDLPPTLLIQPFFTVITQPAYQMGQKGIALLLERISASEAYPGREVILPTELVVRRSCRAVQQAVGEG